MALPTCDVINDLNKLIIASTGIQENSEDFTACKKFCLSYFLHHSYPSISKSTVQAALDGFASRFFTHGYHEVADTFKKVVADFLTHEDVFRANPECEIEWNLLSLLTSLATNLNEVKIVPFLHESFKKEDNDDFDWGAYLKEGLPEQRCFDSDSDSDLGSISSLTSDRDGDFGESDLQTDAEILQREEPSQVHSWNGAYEDAKKAREIKLDVQVDAAKGRFAYIRQQLSDKQDTKPPYIVSEKKVIEEIVCSLLSGHPLQFSTNSVSYISQGTFGDCLRSLEPYIQCIHGFKQFFIWLNRFGSHSNTVVMAYGSALKRCIRPYENALINLDTENISMLRLVDNLRPLQLYIKCLGATHEQCAVQLSEDPPWRASLRILLILYSSVIESKSAQLFSVHFGLFTTCLAAFAEALDSILTSSYPIKFSQDHVIYRDDNMAEFSPSHIYRVHSCQELLQELGLGNIPFLDPIFNKVEEANTSLSLIYLLGRFADISKTLAGLPTLGEVILCSAYSTITGRIDDVPDLEVCDEICAMLLNPPNNGDLEEDLPEIADIFDVSKHSETLDYLAPIHKKIEIAFCDAVNLRIDCIQTLAKKILFKEYKLDRHLTLLRNFMLFHNAAQLIPFTQVLFSPENLRIGNEEERGHSEAFLSVLLRDCLEPDYPDIAHNLSVEVTDLCPNDTFYHIECISISYVVSYPLSLVLTASVLKKYNKIFRALLKIKYVHSILSRLPFLDLDEAPEAKSVIQRLHVLRFNCLADLSHIMSYFMAQASSTLCSDVNDCQNIQDIIRDHTISLDEIHMRCMLNDGDQHFTIIFGRVLPLCLELKNYWSLKNPNLMAGLKRIEELHQINQVLLHILLRHLEHETYTPIGENGQAMATLATTIVNF